MVRAMGTVAALCERRSDWLPIKSGGGRPPLQDYAPFPSLPIASTGQPSIASLETFFVGCLRLLVYVGVPAVIVAFEIGWSRFAAQIAVDALIIDVEFARYVLGVFVR